MLAVFALIAGTATTFSLATPLMASVINVLFGVELNRVAVTIIILIITCIVYTYSLLHGFKGISILAKACIYLFFGLLAFVLLFGGEARYIIETGFLRLEGWFRTFRTGYLYGSRKDYIFSPELDDILLGILMVWCVGGSVFYRQHFQRENGTPDDPWRIYIWSGIYYYQLYYSGKLFSGITGIRGKQILLLFMKSQEICMM